MIHYYCFFACHVSALPIIECGREEGRTRIPATHTKVNTHPCRSVKQFGIADNPPPAPRAHAPDPPAGGGRRGRAQRARRAC